MSITREFSETLLNVVTELDRHSIQWMLIGGGAMYLHGLQTAVPPDIDVVLSEADGYRLMMASDLQNYADQSERRFSPVYRLRPNMGPVDVELLSGFQVNGTVVAPEPETFILLHGISIPCASAYQLKRLFAGIGRDKDLDRIQLIERQNGLSSDYFTS